MKARISLFLTAAILLICCFAALGENNAETVIVTGEEWSWSRGAYNTFSGELSLSDCSGKELTICILTDLPYSKESEQESMPVFTSLNGKRIVMTKQSDTVTFTPGEENSTMRYAVSFRLPEKKRVNSMTVTFLVKDTEDNIIRKLTGRIDSGEEGSGRNGSPFYIPADIGRISAVIAAAAAIVWMIILVRYIRKRKINNTGE